MLYVIACHFTQMNHLLCAQGSAKKAPQALLNESSQYVCDMPHSKLAKLSLNAAL